MLNIQKNQIISWVLGQGPNFFFFEDFIYLFLERGRVRERNIYVGERNIDRLSLTCAGQGNLAHNPGMCPD